MDFYVVEYTVILEGIVTVKAESKDAAKKMVREAMTPPLNDLADNDTLAHREKFLITAHNTAHKERD